GATPPRRTGTASPTSAGTPNVALRIAPPPRSRAGRAGDIRADSRSQRRRAFPGVWCRSSQGGSPCPSLRPSVGGREEFAQSVLADHVVPFAPVERFLPRPFGVGAFAQCPRGDRSVGVPHADEVLLDVAVVAPVERVRDGLADVDRRGP